MGWGGRGGGGWKMAKRLSFWVPFTTTRTCVTTRTTEYHGFAFGFPVPPQERGTPQKDLARGLSRVNGEHAGPELPSVSCSSAPILFACRGSLCGVQSKWTPQPVFGLALSLTRKKPSRDRNPTAKRLSPQCLPGLSGTFGAGHGQSAEGVGIQSQLSLCHSSGLPLRSKGLQASSSKQRPMRLTTRKCLSFTPIYSI